MGPLRENYGTPRETYGTAKNIGYLVLHDSVWIWGTTERGFFEATFILNKIFKKLISDFGLISNLLGDSHGSGGRGKVF